MNMKFELAALLLLLYPSNTDHISLLSDKLSLAAGQLSCGSGRIAIKTNIFASEASRRAQRVCSFTGRQCNEKQRALEGQTPRAALFGAAHQTQTTT